MHISLRTMFVIVTTVAVYLAIHVALLQGIGPMASSLWIQGVLLLPLVVIWVMAAAWVFQHGRELVAAHLVLWAMGLNIGGRLGAEALQAWGYRMFASSTSAGAMLFTASSLVAVAASTWSWALVLLAFARANRGRGVPAVGEAAPVKEAAASPWGGRDRG